MDSLSTLCLPMANQRLRRFLWRTTLLPRSPQSAGVSLRWFVISVYLPSFLPTERCARLRLPFSGSLGPRFPTFPIRLHSTRTIGTVLRYDCQKPISDRFACHSLSDTLQCKETVGSPKFPSYPFEYMPCSQTPVVSRTLALAYPGLLPSAR